MGSKRCELVLSRAMAIACSVSTQSAQFEIYRRNSSNVSLSCINDDVKQTLIQLMDER